MTRGSRERARSHILWTVAENQNRALHKETHIPNSSSAGSYRQLGETVKVSCFTSRYNPLTYKQ